MHQAQSKKDNQRGAYGLHPRSPRGYAHSFSDQTSVARRCARSPVSQGMAWFAFAFGEGQLPEALKGSEFSEAVRAPLFRADTIVYKEQSRRVVFLLQRSEPRIIAAPIGMLPVLFEETTFRDIRSAVWRQCAQLVHANMNPLA